MTGWPVVARAWGEVVEMYFNARATIKKVGRTLGVARCTFDKMTDPLVLCQEFPNVLKARELADAVQYEIRSTREILLHAKEAAKVNEIVIVSRRLRHGLD
ncbi:MAG: hypothetical protein ACKOU6_04525 [Planctomycetota bacterium]